MTDTATSQHVAQIDRQAYELTRDWMSHANKAQLLYRGIHIGHVMQRALWPKVGRALRHQYDSAAATFEQMLHSADLSLPRVIPPTLERDKPTPPLVHRLRHRWQDRQTRRRIKALGGRPVVLTRHSDRLTNLMRQLCSNQRVAILSNAAARADTDGVLQLPHNGGDDSADDATVDRLLKAIIEGVRDCPSGVALLADDIDKLRHELAYELERVARIEAMFDHHPPDAVLLAGDNWPPFITFVLHARARGIPSIYLQHGLDCEHHYPDEAYADAIATWGPARLEQYQQRSTHQPRWLRITGNPQFDHITPARQIATHGKHWVWVTRPHIPEKCLSPSRFPREGLDICNALLAVLADHPEQTLVIKPHPFDYAELYKQRIAEENLQSRVRVATGPVHPFLKEATLVFSEDSTAGMEAMFFGKPVIHTHFALCPPVMPFVEMQAAYPGFDPEQLAASVARAAAMSDADRTTMHEGQRAFIEQFAGPLDGQADARAASLVHEVLSSR